MSLFNKKKNKNVIILNEKTIKKYINLPHNFDKLKNIAHKADYIRISILYKYGGIWIDSDMICLKSFDKIFKMLDHYDFIAFEYRSKLKIRKTHYKYDFDDIVNKKTNHTFRTPIGFLATNKNNILFRDWKRAAENVISNKEIFGWHGIGRMILGPLLEKYVKNKKIKYYSIPAEDTIVPIKENNQYLFNENHNLDLIFKNKNTENQYFITLFFSQMPILKTMTVNDLNKNLLIFKIFKYAIKNCK